MNDQEVAKIQKALDSKSTDELLHIWTTNDRTEWQPKAFEAIKQILLERGVQIHLPLNTMNSNGITKKCPFCAEDIKREAIICRFCGYDLSTGRPATSPKSPSEVKAKSGIMDGVNLGCGMFIVLPLIIIGIFFFLIVLIGLFSDCANRIASTLNWDILFSDCANRSFF